MSTPRSDIAVVSGASGLIGSRVVSALAASGFAVRRLVRRSVRGPDEIRWDPEAGTIDARALEGVDIAVNLAGENIGQRWTSERKRRIRESRVTGTTLLATSLAALSPPPRVLLSASAVGIYGNRGDEILDETSAHGADFLASVCEAWEAATAPAASAGIRVVTPRNGIVLAREGGALAKMLPLFRLGLGGRIGDGRQWISWIALTDIVRAMVFLVTRGEAHGPINLVAPNPVDNAELARTLGAVLRRPAMFPVPAAALRLVMGEMASDTVLASQRVRPKRLLELGFEFQCETLEAALRGELGTILFS